MDGAKAPVAELVRVTAVSISEVVIVAVVGYGLARRGILDKATRSKLNQLNIAVFTPALLFSKVAFTLNAHRLVELSIVPAGFFLVEVVSFFAALVLAKLGRLGPAHTRFAIAATITPNSNSLPVALMQSLVVTVPHLRWNQPGEPPDTTDAMLGRALTYLVLFSTLSMFTRWSIGAHLLTSAGAALSADPSNEETPPHGPRLHLPRWAASFPNTPLDSDTTGAGSDLSAAQVTLQPSGVLEQERWAQRFVRRPLRALHGIMTPPLWAAILSLIVAIIPPVQNTLASMGPLKGALNSCGACSIPLTLIALGGYFFEPKHPSPTTEAGQIRLEEHRPERARSIQEIKHGLSESKRAILVTVCARQIVCPLILVPLIAFIALRSTNKVLDDPVFLVSACLIAGSPPAVTLAQITAQTAHRNGLTDLGAIERLISRTIFVAYTMLATPMTIILVLIALLIAAHD